MPFAGAGGAGGTASAAPGGRGASATIVCEMTHHRHGHFLVVWRACGARRLKYGLLSGAFMSRTKLSEACVLNLQRGPNFAGSGLRIGGGSGDTGTQPSSSSEFSSNCGGLGD